jgi:hypothetical protein
MSFAIRVVELGELLHRVEEVAQVEHEGEQGADLDRAREIPVCAVAEDDGRRGGRQEVDEGKVEAVGHHGDVVCLPVVRVHVAEMALVGGLARERLHDPHACDVLREGGGDHAQALADRPVGA